MSTITDKQPAIQASKRKPGDILQNIDNPKGVIEPMLHWKEIETRSVRVGNIHIVDRIMPPTKTRVDAMAKSLSGPLGQLQPILVTKHLHSAWKVVTGATRLLAARGLGWKQIRATIISADNDIEYRLIEIAENLDRHDLSKTERAQLKAKNKELHAQRLAEFERLTENDTPKAKGGRGKKGGIRDAARKAGVPLATAQRRIGKPTQNEDRVSLDQSISPEPPKQSMREASMPRCMPFDDQDKAALHKLDSDIIISADGEVAVISGEMEVELIRLVDDDGTRFRLTITFPGGEQFEVRVARAQLLQELEIEVDES